jgi:hypothetical protein
MNLEGNRDFSLLVCHWLHEMFQCSCLGIEGGRGHWNGVDDYLSYIHLTVPLGASGVTVCPNRPTEVLYT